MAAGLARLIEGLVRRVVVPITGLIPGLVERGILLAVFAVLWVAFGAALIADPQRLAAVWAGIGQLPLPVQALVWLLFLPLMAGLWIWSTDWATALRIVLVGGIAGWNLLVFIPRRPAVEPAPAAS